MAPSNARRALPFACVLVAACSPYTETTVVQTKSALDVAVQDADSDSRLPGNAEPISAEVARTEVETGPGSTSDLIVIATRRPGGSIVTEWQTRLPLLNGERHVLVDQTGTATLAGIVAIDTKGSQVTIPVCGTLQQQAHKGMLLGYGVVASTSCDGPYMTRINLETPKDNIVVIHHLSTNQVRGVAVVAAVANTLILGGIGALLTFADLQDEDGNPAPLAVRGVGVGFLALGGAIDLALLPAIFAPNKDEVIYPAAK